MRALLDIDKVLNISNCDEVDAEAKLWIEYKQL